MAFGKQEEGYETHRCGLGCGNESDLWQAELGRQRLLLRRQAEERCRRRSKGRREEQVRYTVYESPC